jgi:GSH-dependent disulfide-bond oxidoreductase
VIKLYFWPTPNCQKIAIMLEECELPYEIVPVNITRGEQFSPEFLKLNPNNRVPAILDPDGPGGKPISVFESGAILLYLSEKTGRFMPKDVRARIRVHEWLFWQVSALGPMSGQAQHFRCFAPEKITYAIERYTREVNRLYGVLNRYLKDREFLVDEYSIADIAAWPWVYRHDRLAQNLDEFPAVKRWFDAIGSRPQVQKGRATHQELLADSAPPDEAHKVLFYQTADLVAEWSQHQAK